MSTVQKTTEQTLQDHVSQIAADLQILVDKYPNNGDYTEEDQEAWFSYWSDVLDVNYLVNRDKSLKAVKILVAFGGPNIWIDTETSQVEGYWWNDRANAHLSNEVVEAIDNEFEQSWECM